ncbi:hypothetical protein K469DRAFT_606919, partial [Zopfia rhizophila CBS 207.26]
LYTKSLYQLQTKLEYKYNLNYIKYILYALAVDIYCFNTILFNLEYKPAYCFLTNRNTITYKYK